MTYEMWVHRGTRCQIELLPTRWDLDRCKEEAEKSAYLTNVTLVEVKDDATNKRVYACKSVDDDTVAEVLS